MKTFLPCTVAACLAINFASAQWVQLTSPTINNLYAVTFSNEKFGYAAGAKGTVLRTTDGGATWTTLPSPDTADISSIVIVDSLTVIVTTANNNGQSVIYKSATRGNNWQKILSDDRAFYTIKMPDGNLYSTSTYAYKSLNKGATWLSEQQLNSTSIYNEIDFADDQRGFIGGNVIGDTTFYAEFLRSENGGQRWYPSYSFAFPNHFAFSSMNAINADTLFMFTNFERRFHQKDSSQLLMLFNFRLRHVGRDTIWNFQSKFINQSFPDIIHSCKFFSDTLAFAAGDRGSIYVSRTAGKKWEKEYRGKISINNLYMINTDKGYAVGNNGLILKRGTAPAGNLSPTFAFKVYPNPSVNNATVNFTSTNSSDIILQLVDERGIIVYTQRSTSIAGNNQLVIPVANLPRGVYHLNIIADGNLKGKAALFVTH